MSVTKKDMYLHESKNLKDKILKKNHEIMDVAGDPMLRDSEDMSISTNLRRIALYLSKAKTPGERAIAFELANNLIRKYPLKAKIIMSAVVNAYKKKFGSIAKPE